jgi:hypothetical protein
LERVATVELCALASEDHARCQPHHAAAAVAVAAAAAAGQSENRQRDQERSGCQFEGLGAVVGTHFILPFHRFLGWCQKGPKDPS